MAAEHDMSYEPVFTMAGVAAHDAKDVGNTCGCKCGLYTPSNWTLWNGKKDFHRVNSSCKCGCPAKKHFPIARAGCTRLCDGNCTGLFADTTWGETAGALYDEKYHDPSDAGCKCGCEYFSGQSAPDKFHTKSNATVRCYCVCMAKHKFRTARSDCTKICRSCGNTHEYAVAPSEPQTPGEHSWANNHCKCKCPEEKLNPKGHQFDSDKCVCKCGDTTRGHIYRQVSKTQTGTSTCPTCGNTITYYHIVYRCSRCGDVWDGEDVEEGHASNCGQGGGSTIGSNYCSLHQTYYLLECPHCKESDEDGEGGAGGSTPGAGGYDDI